MKSLKNLYKLVLGFCLSAALMATAAEPASVTKDELAAQKELLQLQIDSKKELLQKDIESQSKRIDTVDKRIDDQMNRVGDIGTAVDRYGVAVTYIGLVITILLVGIGVFGYRTAKSDAKEAAEKVAKEEAQKWFEQNKKLFAAQIQEIETRLKEALNQIDFHVQAVKDRSVAAGVEIEVAMEDMQTMQLQMNKKNSDLKSPDIQSSSAVGHLAEELKKRPESSYSFDDWNTRAFAAYKEGKIEDAAFYWGKAADVPAAGATNSAQSMYNKGLMLGQLNRNEEAISTYEELISKYRDEPESSLREHVASAMFNKGNAFSQLDQIEQEKAAYSALISKFNDEQNPIVFELVVNAMINKGFALLCEAKSIWGAMDQVVDLLNEAKSILLTASNKQPNSAFIYGNLAYVNWLLGDLIEAEKYFRIGLAAQEDGGEMLYKTTLKDFEIHPIAEDEGFKALVEKLWAEYQQNQKPAEQA